MHTRAGIAGGTRGRVVNPARMRTLGLLLAALSLLPSAGLAASTKDGHTSNPPAHHPLKAAGRLLKRAGHWLQVARPLAKKFTTSLIAPHALHP